MSGVKIGVFGGSTLGRVITVVLGGSTVSGVIAVVL